ncbi:MAG: hypothetical protein ACI814_000586 [Mariniblastus sp.]|jgi:hypothetical protein
MGWYCCQLNQRLYSHHHPFYDSLSYNANMLRTITEARESGFAAAMELACFQNATNCLPFIVGAVIAPVVDPSRMIGVWIQTAFLFLFLASLLYYLVRVHRLAATTALAGCLAFLAAKCLIFPNGGLSDFRMDLSLYLTFGMTCVWYLISMSRPTKINFILLGASASMACLFRATAPIYLLFCLGPVCLIDLFPQEQRREKLIGIVTATLTVVLLSGWFFYFNFEYLKYYYFEWNTDANAKLPFSEAARHWKLAQRSIGEPLAYMILIWLILVTLVTRRKSTIGTWLKSAWLERSIDWRIAWLGLGPVVMLIARRAGLNPFVCMPAVFGLVLFFLLPCLKQIERLADKTLTRTCWTLLIIALALSATRGWMKHGPDEFNTRQAHNELIDVVIADAKQNEIGTINFAVIQLTDLDSNGLYSSLLFDRPDISPGLNSVHYGDKEIFRIPTFARPAATDWKNIKGETDEEKRQFLIDDANVRINYLIVPDERSAEWLQQSASHNFINRHLVPLRAKIVSDPSWVLIAAPIKTNEKETVEVYRKQR